MESLTLRSSVVLCLRTASVKTTNSDTCFDVSLPQSTVRYKFVIFLDFFMYLFILKMSGNGAPRVASMLSNFYYTDAAPHSDALGVFRTKRNALKSIHAESA